MTERQDGMTVGPVAERHGVTVRTLHHDDEIGLLRPSRRSTAGYRLYSADDLVRLRHVVLHRRLGDHRRGRGGGRPRARTRVLGARRDRGERRPPRGRGWHGDLMLRLGFPVIGVTDLDRAAAFWCAALGLVEVDEWASAAWRTLDGPDGEHALGLMLSASPPEPRPRIHLDLLVDTTDEQDAAVRRLVELGATVADWDDYPPEPDFVVLADPDGNVFCVVDLSRAPSGG